MFASADSATKSKAGTDTFTARARNRSRNLPLAPTAGLDHRALQGAIGNQATLRLLSRCARDSTDLLQRAPRVSDPQDPAERQAERIAAEVVNAPAQPARTTGNEPQRHPEVTPDAMRRIQSAGSGAQLPTAMRDLMEPRFGADFSAVRIHDDPAANLAAKAVDARAFTIGNEIFFGQGEFTPGSASGQRLIAHELTHVMQQGRAAPLSGASGVAAMRLSVETGHGIFRQEEQPKPTENTAPMPEQTATEQPEQAPAPSDNQDGQDGELSAVSEEALPAAACGTAAVADGVIYRQPPQPGAPAPQPTQPPPQPAPPPAQPAQPAPQPAAATKVTVKPVAVLKPVVGKTSKGTDGETKLSVSSDIKWKTKGGKITSYKGTVTPTIQTTYLPTADQKANSAYGRGTTGADKTAGNTSLEFHESSHAEDYKGYFQNHPLPVFTGTEGMSEADFKAAVQKYNDELQKYRQAATDDSKQSTDCVGVKEKTCQ